MSVLYVIATPIGNLEDISPRALRILAQVDLVLCEDTRHTKKLLSHYDIHTPTLSYHAHSRLAKIDKIAALIADGKDMALVSDAGTPSISDPGAVLIRALREQSSASDLSVVPIPGPSALAAALSVAGATDSEFSFLGFVPHKKGRETFFKRVTSIPHTVVLYESPHRILKTLSALSACMPDRSVTVARELTKIHEEVRTATAVELLAEYERRPEAVRGEWVLVIHPQP